MTKSVIFGMTFETISLATSVDRSRGFWTVGRKKKLFDSSFFYFDRGIRHEAAVSAFDVEAEKVDAWFGTMNH